MSNLDAHRRQSRLRRRENAIAAAAMSGLVVGASLVGVSSAVADPSPECAAGNTLDASTGKLANDIQTLLNAGAPVVCLSGDFALSTPLVPVAHVAFIGVTDAVLNGQGLTRLIEADGFSVSLNGLRLEHGNAAGEDGGAVLAGEIHAVDSVFFNNGAAAGGALAGVRVTVSGSSFVNNVALDEGAAISVQWGTPGEGELAISTSTFAGNDVLAGNGGAVMFVGYGAAVIQSSTFVDNTAANGAAIAQADPPASVVAPMTIVNSTFSQNTAVNEGGAVYMTGSGGVYLTTFQANTAAEPSGGGELPGAAIYLEATGVEAVDVYGSVFVGSTDNPQLGVGGIIARSLFHDLGGNLFTTAEAAEADFGATLDSTFFGVSPEAIFGPNGLGDNGGPTQTVRLVDGSPAIGAVPPIVLPTPSPRLTDTAVWPVATATLDLSVDQRGEGRVYPTDAGAVQLPAVPELAATGGETATAGWLAGIAALLLGSGAAVVVGARIRSRAKR